MRLEAVTRLQAGIGRVEEWIGIALIAAMAVVVNLQVFARYLFDSPFVWSEEVTRLILVWMTFIAAAALIRRGGDIAVDTFINMMPKGPRRATMTVRDLLMIAVYGLLAWEGWRLAHAVAGMPLVATDWPTALLAWPLVVGAGLIVLHVALRLLHTLSGGEVLPPVVGLGPDADIHVEHKS